MSKSDKIEKIIKQSDSLSLRTNELVDFLSDLRNEEGSGFDLAQTIPGKDSSTADILARIHSVCGIVEKFNTTKQGELAPTALLDEFTSQLDNTSNVISGLRDHLDQSAKKVGIRNFVYDNFHIILVNNQQVNCQPQFDSVFSQSEALLRSFFTIVHILRPRSSASFQGAASALSGLIEKANTLHSQSQSCFANIEKDQKAIEGIKTSAQQAGDEVIRSKKEIDADRKTIAEYLAKSTDDKTKIEGVQSDASSLKSKIDAYQKQFEEFQAALDNRNSEFSNGSSNLESLLKGFQENKSTVEGLISRSQEMLSAATVAGIASHFGTIKDSLTNELDSARKSFYWGIFFLFVSSIPLMLLILAPAYLKVIGWGWFYLSTILDDFSRYIIAWKLCTTMKADDVTDTLELALKASSCDQATVVHRPRLLSDNGSSYVAGDLATWLEKRDIIHVRGAPYHPQTQGKIERWHQTLKNRILLENYYLPGDLEAQIEGFVDHYNHHRYHESLENLTPADVYLGRGKTILLERERIKRQTIQQRRLQHQIDAA